jgi:hypothetical protein
MSSAVLRASPLRAAVLLAVLLAAGTAAAAGPVAVYVNRVVSADPGDVSLGDLVRVPGELDGETREALARSVTVLQDKVLVVTTSVYSSQLGALFGTDVIVVGSRSIVVPRGSPADGQGYLLERLAEFILSQSLAGVDRLELAYTQVSVRGLPPQDGAPAFHVQKSGRGTEVSFSLTGTDGGFVSGRVAFTAHPAPDIAAGVKSGAPVQVIFHKGALTIEMPGKSLAAAAIGTQVKVYLSESQMSFMGRVIDGKAVDVELP